MSDHLLFVLDSLIGFLTTAANLCFNNSELHQLYRLLEVRCFEMMFTCFDLFNYNVKLSYNITVCKLIKPNSCLFSFES